MPENNEKNNPYQYSQDILDGIEEIKKYRVKKEEFFSNLEQNPLWVKHLEELLQAQEDKPTQDRKGKINNLAKKIEQMKELWSFYELYTKK